MGRSSDRTPGAGSSGGGGAPSGSAGGDLTGTYPDPGIAAGVIVNADINASAAIAKSKLAALDVVNADVNASAAIARSKLDLGSGLVNADIAAGAAIAKSKLAALDVVNADVNAAAAIAYSKLNLGTSIVNADVAAGAAIAKTKLASLDIVNADVNAAAAIAASKLSGVVANTLVDAKGDILTASAADTPARLAVGANGLALVAASPEPTGLKYGGGVRRWALPYMNGVANTSQVFTVGRVYLVQFEVPFGGTADAIAYMTGSASVGNVTLGIYGSLASNTDTCAGAAVVVQSASTAQGTAAANQVVTFTATPLTAGIYYAALEGDNASGTFSRLNSLTSGGQTPGACQYYDRGGGYGALTDPCPAVTEYGSAVPGMRVRLQT